MREGVGTSLWGSRLGYGGHGVDLGAGQATYDGGVEGAVGGKLSPGLGGIRGGHSNRALRFCQTVEVVAVAGVQVAVEGLLLGEALGGVGAYCGADVAEDRGGGAACFLGAGLYLLAGAGGELGVIQLKKAPS